MDGELIDAARQLVPAGAGRAVLGIAGPPGAGKSSLARSLVEELNAGERIAGYCPLDGFHLSNAQLDRLGLGSRKGSMGSFDVWGYVATLRRLLAEPEHTAYLPDFDRTLDEPVAARHAIAPDVRLVVTEGNYLAMRAAGWNEARELLSALWYVETAESIREQRLLERHMATGRSRVQACAWVRGNDRPNGRQVETNRVLPDRVVRSGGPAR